jgi:serine phosphatase RsbU (regulator of sigma subunit)/predicted enzyme related to lactoylglutathione lyase
MALRLHHIPVFVRDQERSLTFYRDLLGFAVTVDYSEGAERFILVQPPGGNVSLALLRPKDETRIGTSNGIVFVTVDVQAQFESWSNLGVQFQHAPMLEQWGGAIAPFYDPDGNRYILAGWDDFTRAAEAERLRLEEQQQAEQRAATERQVASDVQSRLFPQALPAVRSLELAGRCLQARDVGGDYYDFLDLGGDLLGLVVGDVSGKGMGAALLMANLQANLRGQSAVLGTDLPRGLATVNDLFLRSSPGSAFATLFCATYCDTTRRVVYANCGHVAALVVRRTGVVERLASTCGMVGLFANWRCATAECALEAGDLLVVVSDGVTEAMNDDGLEFGEESLIASIVSRQHLAPGELIAGLLEDVQAFASGPFQDDVTVVALRVRS